MACFLKNILQPHLQFDMFFQHSEGHTAWWSEGYSEKVASIFFQNQFLGAMGQKNINCFKIFYPRVSPQFYCKNYQSLLWKKRLNVFLITFYSILSSFAPSDTTWAFFIWNLKEFLVKFFWAFLDFRGFNFRNFWFTAVYNSILFSSPLVLLSNLDLRVSASAVFHLGPHINSVNRGMPVTL